MDLDEQRAYKGAHPGRIWAIGIALAFSVITSYYHQFVYISQPNVNLVVKDHFEVIGGHAMAPTQYRLAPYFLAQGAQALAVMMGAPNDSNTLLRVYLVIQVIVMAAGYYLLLVFLSKWFDSTRSVLGLCFLVAVNPLAEYQYYHQPGDPWSFLFFLMGYFALVAGRDIWLFPIIFIGTPFRETIALLIPAYVAVRWGRIPVGRLIFWTLALGLTFLIPFEAIRLHYGPLANYLTTRNDWEKYGSTFLYNLTHLDGWIVVLLYFNVLWAALVIKWRYLPRVVRRLFIIVPIVLATSLIWGRIVEARLYLSILPLFIPAGLLLLGPLKEGEGEG
jgi:hypothetical protein